MNRAPDGAAAAQLPEVGCGLPGQSAISRTFSLGWQMTALYDAARRTGGSRPSAGASDALPSTGTLPATTQTAMRFSRVSTLVRGLVGCFTSLDIDPPSLEAVRRGIGSGDADEARSSVLDLHIALLERLTEADPRLAKAYSLGRALAYTCQPTPTRGLNQLLNPYRLRNLQEWLADLSSLFPPRAAVPVALSLVQWQNWLRQTPDVPASNEPLSARLRRQGQVWQSLLTGEKEPLDSLTPSGYVDAAAGVISRAGRLMGRFLVRSPLLVLASALFAMGVYLLLNYEATGKLIAGGSTIVTALAITWRGTRGILSGIAKQLETPLWDAELDFAIARAITITPPGARTLSRRALNEISAADPALASIPPAPPN